jgi:hypothetical protein
MRRADRGDLDRPHGRQRALPLRRELRAAVRDRTDPVLLGAAYSAPPQPRRGQLNHALHIPAITRAQRDPATKEYLSRKEAEGKTAKGALRCLKRHLARHFHQLLAQPATGRRRETEDEPAAIPPPNSNGVAPCPMICIS